MHDESWGGNLLYLRLITTSSRSRPGSGKVTVTLLQGLQGSVSHTGVFDKGASRRLHQRLVHAHDCTYALRYFYELKLGKA